MSDVIRKTGPVVGVLKRTNAKTGRLASVEIRVLDGGKKWPFRFFGRDGLPMVEGVAEGEDVTVEGVIDPNEWQDKLFLNINGTSLRALPKQPAANVHGDDETAF